MKREIGLENLKLFMILEFLLEFWSIYLLVKHQNDNWNFIIGFIFKVNYSRPPPNALYRLITACIRWKVSDTSFNCALSNDCCAVMISR